MFGWLAHAFASTRSTADTAAWTISRTSVRMPGVELAARLPLLGGVLYLPACRSPGASRDLVAGWLVARDNLGTLLRTNELRASCMIGAAWCSKSQISILSANKNIPATVRGYRF